MIYIDSQETDCDWPLLLLHFNLQFRSPPPFFPRINSDSSSSLFFPESLPLIAFVPGKESLSKFQIKILKIEIQKKKALFTVYNIISNILIYK